MLVFCLLEMLKLYEPMREIEQKKIFVKVILDFAPIFLNQDKYAFQIFGQKQRCLARLLLS
jgi:hypothetical protein